MASHPIRRPICRRGVRRRRHRRLRSAFAASPRSAPPTVVMAAPAAYAEPAPIRYDAAYHLDAGDRLRVVVYGQEGLTNTYAIDAGGSITMPLIGSVPARGRTTAGLAAEIGAKLRRGIYQGALGRGGGRSVSAVLYPRRGRGTRAVSLCAEHDSRERGRYCRWLFATRAPRSVTVTHTDASGPARFVVPPGSSISPGDTVLVGERWF